MCTKTCFCHLNVVWRPLAEEQLAISMQSVHHWKVHLLGYNSVADKWQYGFIFIRLAVIAYETREMAWNPKRIWPYSSSRSSKIINLGVSGKTICDFVLVINSGFIGSLMRSPWILKKKFQALESPCKSLKSPWIWMFHILKFLHIKILKKALL